jgi:hypothetical protein
VTAVASADKRYLEEITNRWARGAHMQVMAEEELARCFYRIVEGDGFELQVRREGEWTFGGRHKDRYGAEFKLKEGVRAQLRRSAAGRGGGNW